MPLESQLRHLEEALEHEDPRVLLERCAPLRDHAPLSWLTRRLLERGWLAQPLARAWFARFVVERSETAVDRILKAMLPTEHVSLEKSDDLEQTLLEVLRAAKIEQVTIMCLVDRAMRQHFSAAHDAHVEGLIVDAEQAVQRGELALLDPSCLAQIPADGITRLRTAARAQGTTMQTLEAALLELAKTTLEVLGRAPKGVSQANAEELLSQRVYTEPGHFLFELLQNADDAGARTWKLRLEPRRIVVWHDGTPFDTRDVVGVTSIGQTTKRKQQIGFFGVGFKSVYEITERPQIYSDIYRFEIADVSIPKLLSRRPPDLPPTGTVLILPLRNEADPVRSPAALFEKARSLDAVVLFTLRNINAIELELVHPSGEVEQHALRELPEDARGVSRIRIDGAPDATDTVRTYARVDDAYHYDQSWRAPGRVDTTRIMVGVSLGLDGRPRPLDSGAATIYSYLPTEEHSGLRFFVQGHFDVPVDRERIHPDSPWNAWILERVPPGLAAIADRLTKQAPTSSVLATATALLEVLPRPEELGAPIFAHITRGLRSAFAAVAIVPCTDDQLHRPSEAVVASPEIASLFEGTLVRLPNSNHARAFTRPELDARAVAIVQALGCGRFTVADLVTSLEHTLADAPDETPDLGAEAPLFLRRPTPSRMARLYAVCLSAIDGDAHPETVIRLRPLPIVLTERGTLARAGPTGPVRGTEAIRTIMRGTRVFVHPELDAKVAVAAAASSAWLDHLGTVCLELEDLVTQLEPSTGDRPSISLGIADLTDPEDGAVRRRALLELARGAPLALQRRLGRLPLFAARGGGFHPAARDPADRHGVLLPETGPPAEHLAAYYLPRRPLADPDDPGIELLRHIRTPPLDLDALVADLTAQAPTLPDDELDALYALLDTIADDLPGAMRRALAALPLWHDTDGRRRPLEGPDAARLPASDTLAGLFEHVPFVHPRLRQHAHLRSLADAPIDVGTVIEALDPTARAPWRIEPRPETLATVHTVLLEQRDAITAPDRDRLRRVPAFTSDGDTPHPVGALGLCTDPELRALYGEAPARPFIDPDGRSLQVIRALGLVADLREVDAATLVDELATSTPQLDGARVTELEHPLATDRQALHRVLAYLARVVAILPTPLVRRCTDLAIFEDQHGQLGPLGISRPPRPRRVHGAQDDLRALFELSGHRVLPPEVQEIIEPLLEAAGAEPLDIVALVDELVPLAPVPRGARRAPLQQPSALPRIHRLLGAHASTLAHRFPLQARADGPLSSATLCALAIWPTAAGGVDRAESLVISGEFTALLQDGTPERAALDEQRVSDAATEALEGLEPLVRPRPFAQALASIVQRFARVGARLSEQPRLLSSRSTLVQTAELLSELPDAKVPILDATGRLRFPPLLRTDQQTATLLEGTPVHGELCDPALVARLPSRIQQQLEDLTAVRVLQALAAAELQADHVAGHPWLADPARRDQFYAWLCSHESQVFTHADARELLRRLPLFPTERSSLRAAEHLVIDPDLPALGVDWTPHPEIPVATLELLVRHLGIGRPNVADLLEGHLMPAYRRAVQDQDTATAVQLLLYIGHQLTGTPATEVREIVHGGDLGFAIADDQDRFQRIDALVLPSTEVEQSVVHVFGKSYPRPAAALAGALGPWLHALGVPALPAPSRVASAMREAVTGPTVALGLATLCGHLYQDDPAVLEQLPLQEAAWILDGAGFVRRGDALFAWSADVESLVGADPGLYPAPEFLRALGDSLTANLGLRSVEDVRPDEVVAHLEQRAAEATLVPFRVYAWLEDGLRHNRIDANTLRGRLEHAPWICTDDGTYHPHRRVLGIRALQLFGSRRGYWERGRQYCPTLFSVFEIPTAPRPDVIVEFLNEIARDVRAHSDAGLLEAEPALPRMLLRCYAELGKGDAVVDVSAPTILCRTRGPATRHASDSPLALRSATDPTVLRSDTPALEAMFEAVGTFHVASPGLTDDRNVIDAFYERCGIRRLREAYTVEVGEAGIDRTVASAHQLNRLRGLLQALASVLPRVRRQRRHLAAEGWVFEQRLRPLARDHNICVIENLEVDYVLPEVGRVRTRTPAAYDPATRRLLIDVEVATSPATHATGLALGLMACVYDGPGEEQLVDIIELLLQLGHRSPMDAYLDRRYFPTADVTEEKTCDRFRQRLADLFDYGLDRRLVTRFDELEGRVLIPWRDPGLADGLPEDSEEAIPTLVRRMIAAVDLPEASPPLWHALTMLLYAPTLDDIPVDLLGEQRAATQWTTTDRPPPESVPTPSTLGEQEPNAAVFEAAVLETLDMVDAVAAHGFGQPLGWSESFGGVIPAVPAPPTTGAHPRAGSVTSPGLLGRLARWLGLGDGRPLDLGTVALPPWARPQANVFEPRKSVGPQLWTRPDALRDLLARPANAGLVHSPTVLPSPYRYAIHTLGTSFDPRLQVWMSGRIPALPAVLTTGRTGHAVSFAGELQPGNAVLPIPLYGEMSGFEVVQGEATQVEVRGRTPYGAVQVHVTGKSPVHIRYQVDLRRVPVLGTGDLVETPEALVRPTLSRAELPAPLRRLLDESARHRGDWQRATAVQGFVQRHYIYDVKFMERPETRRCLASLRLGVGNHHLAVLHAGATDGVLGRGICYELNVLVVELLRHLGIPAMVAAGWLLDEGVADRPDHLFAVALLASSDGQCLLPLDASTGPEGPRRPLAGSRPATHVRVRTEPAVPDVPGPWNIRPEPGPPDPADGDERLHALEREEHQRLVETCALLHRATLLAHGSDSPVPHALQDLIATMVDDPAAALTPLRRLAEHAVGDPNLLDVLLSVMRGDFEGATELPAPVQELAQRGLVATRTIPVFRVWPVDVPARDPE